jgi:hypothetical protein
MAVEISKDATRNAAKPTWLWMRLNMPVAKKPINTDFPHLYVALYENRRLPPAITQEANAGFHHNCSIIRVYRFLSVY